MGLSLDGTCSHAKPWVIYAESGEAVSVDMNLDGEVQRADSFFWCADCGQLCVKGVWYPDDAMQASRGIVTWRIVANILLLMAGNVEELQYDDTDSEQAAKLGRLVSKLKDSAHTLFEVFAETDGIALTEDSSGNVTH